MNTKVINYSNFTLTLIKAAAPNEITDTYKGIIRAELLFNAQNQVEMSKKGFTFADRTLEVAINLKRSKIDYEKLIRFEIRKEQTGERKKILEIALDSFQNDSRFDICNNKSVYDEIISGWVKNLSNVNVCTYKEKIIGFLDLEPFEEKNLFIHLAAVEEKYRAAGAAVSLYAHAVYEAKNKGCEKIYGRISSINTSVMNLYANLGGMFSNPLDVFVKDAGK